MLVADKENLLFQFDAMKRFRELTHAVVCRSGGVSRPPFDSLNLGRGVGDVPEAVAANRRRLRQLTGGGVHVYASQRHGTDVGVVTGPVDHGEPIRTYPRPVDALITDVPGVRLLIQTADCQAVMLYDPIRRVAANVHCGWRGSVTDIIGRTVATMRDAFGCDPGGMAAVIGPSLGPCCAEFIHFKREIPRRFWPFRVGQHHFDFWRISRRQLVDAGLADGSVHVSGLCTRCNPHLFFSYRADRRTGRFAALIGLDAQGEGVAQ